MADVKVPALLHKMSVSSQKAWYKKHGMELPGHLSGAEGKSAAQAKKDVGEINKAKAKRLEIIAAAAKKIVKPSSERVRSMRQNADTWGGGLGGGLDRNRDIVSHIRSGGYIKAGRLGEEVEQIDEVNAKQIQKDLDSGMSHDAVIGKHANKKLSNTNEIRKIIQQHAWNKRMKKEEVEQVDETNGEYNKYGHIKPGSVDVDPTSTDKPPVYKTNKKPAQYKPQKEEADAVKMARGIAFDKRYKGGNMTGALNAIRKVGTKLKYKNLENHPKVKSALKAANEETEMKYIEEKLTAADPASKWISDFVKSDNPKFAGKSKKERIQMALGAKYASMRKEEVEQTDEAIRGYIGRDQDKAIRRPADQAERGQLAKDIMANRQYNKAKGVAGYASGNVRKNAAGMTATQRTSRVVHSDTINNKTPGPKKFPYSEEVEQIVEGPSHLQYSGYVNGKEYTVHVPGHKDLGDYTDERLHKKLSKENPHLAHHEITAIVQSGGAEESHEKVSHGGKEYTHHVENNQEPDYIYEEIEQIDELKASTLGSYMSKASKDEVARKEQGKEVQAKFKEAGMKVGVPYDRKLHSKTASRAAGKAMALKKLTGAAKVAANEEVEQTDEEIKQRKASVAGDGVSRLAFRAGTADEVKKNHLKIYKKLKSTDPEKAAKFKKANKVEESAEGKTPETSTEVELAKKHGDPKKITYGDVIKARIEAAKKKAVNKGE